MNTAALFNLLPAISPFQPTVSAAPASYSAALAGPVLTVALATSLSGSAAIGSTANGLSYTLTNTGSSAINITGATAVGVQAADFLPSTACNGVLAAGASCNLPVAFTPTTTGARTADLAVNSNAANGTVSAPLAATATQPAYSPGGTGFLSPSVQFTFSVQVGSSTLDNMNLVAYS